jgi:hypothetical protein
MKNKLKGNWEPKHKTRMPKEWEHPEPKYEPGMSNHDRMMRKRNVRRKMELATREVEKRFAE